MKTVIESSSIFPLKHKKVKKKKRKCENVTLACQYIRKVKTRRSFNLKSTFTNRQLGILGRVKEKNIIIRCWGGYERLH